jgi:3-oxoacyl-[acyl-carrier-protein] synthase-1
MSLLPALADELAGKDRMVALAAPALAECAAADRRVTATSTSPARPILLLGCPSPRPGFAATDAEELLRAIARAAGVDACPNRSAAFAVGHAGFAFALERALSEQGGAQGAPIFVGCVDTCHDAEAVTHYDAELRIHSWHNPDGFVPAEGAAFLAVRGTGVRAPAFGAAVFAATDVEHTVIDGVPNLARAATSLVTRAAQVLSPREDKPLGWYLRTTNRERHRAREEQFVATRLPHLFDPDATWIDELAEHIGDAGAASGALLAVYVCHGFASGYAPHGTAVISLASVGPERGIVVLREATRCSSPTRASGRATRSRSGRARRGSGGWACLLSRWPAEPSECAPGPSLKPPSAQPPAVPVGQRRSGGRTQARADGPQRQARPAARRRRALAAVGR